MSAVAAPPRRIAVGDKVFRGNEEHPWSVAQVDTLPSGDVSVMLRKYDAYSGHYEYDSVREAELTFNPCPLDCGRFDCGHSEEGPR